MQQKIDVHVLRRPSHLIPVETRELYNKWWEQCLSSLSNPLIKLHVIQGIETPDFFSLRKKGFSLGNLDYVSFVNDDDVVIGDCFPTCVDYLRTHDNLCGVYTNSYIQNPIHQNTQMVPFYNHSEWTKAFHLRHPRPVHEIAVMRRKFIEQSFIKIENFLDEISEQQAEYLILDGEQTIFTALASYGEWKFFPDVFGLVWRKTTHGRHQQTLKRNTKISFKQIQILRSRLME